MKQGRNPCLGCGCNIGGSIDYSYCSLCSDNKCDKCGLMGVKSDLCFHCRENR